MSTELYPKVYLYKRIVQAKLFIDDNYTRYIDLHNIADEACFSRFHFLRLFRKTYGRTPHQYLVQKRIDKAKELLKGGSPVTEVCYSVGFESLGSFSVLFKRVTGCAPSAWQLKEIQASAEVISRPLAFVPGCFASASGWLPAAAQQ